MTPRDADSTAEGASAEPSAAAAAARLEQAIEAFQRDHDREGSFRVVFDHFYPVVLRFFRKRVFSAEDQLDLTQETFLRVYKGLEGFRREARLGTWLFRIAHNTHLKWLRRLHPDEVDAIALSESDAESDKWRSAEAKAVANDGTALDDTLLAERRRLLREAIEELPAQMRESTRLRVYQDLSYREIAIVMRLSVETVKVHLFQARKKLKTKLQDAFEIRI